MEQVSYDAGTVFVEVFPIFNFAQCQTADKTIPLSLLHIGILFLVEYNIYNSREHSYLGSYEPDTVLHSNYIGYTVHTVHCLYMALFPCTVLILLEYNTDIQTVHQYTESCRTLKDLP